MIDCNYDIMLYIDIYMIARYLLFVQFVLFIAAQNILTTIDFTQNVVYTTNRIRQNFVGLSFSFPQLYNDLSNTLLRGYVRNSLVYTTAGSGFRVSFKMQDPKGYKYDCDSYKTLLNPNAACIRDLSKNLDLNNLNSFAAASLASGSTISIGMDMEYANFTDNNFYRIFSDYVNTIYYNLSYGLGIGLFEVFDQADLYQAKGIRPSYSPAQFNEQAYLIYFESWFYIGGPGLSMNASKQWIDTFNNFSFYGLGTFTVYAQIFNNSADVTIANLLNQNYYRPFIQNRFTGTGGIINPSIGRAAITDLRIVGGDGVAGVTDTMAAAIWALDFAMECALFGLRYVLFNNDLSSTNVQSPLGKSPNFTPRGQYYGMLMMSLINTQNYAFTTQTVTAGTSGNIKVYGFYINTQQAFLLINKDTNPSASGVVQINMVTGFNMSCMYMSASDLASKDITIAGYTFLSGDAAAQGSFAMFNYTPDATGHKVPLNYSQVAYCTTLVPGVLFVKDTSNDEMYQHLLIYVLALLIFLAF